MDNTFDKNERNDFELTFGLPLNAESVEAATNAADDLMKNEEPAPGRLQVMDCGLGGDDPVSSDLAPYDTSQGSGNPECFKVMTRYLPKRWLEYFYGDGEQMSYRDAVVVHDISSRGLSTDEMESLRRAELDSAILRIEHDPACQPLFRSILTKAIGEGALDEVNVQRVRNVAAQSPCGTNGNDDLVALRLKSQPKTFKVLLQKMTPVYTLVPIAAANNDEAARQALNSAEEFSLEFSHDRLPGHEIWSLIPPVDIFMPAEDGEPKVLGVLEGNVDTAGLTCRGSAIVTGDGLIVAPQFMESGSGKEIDPEEGAV